MMINQINNIIMEEKKNNPSKGHHDLNSFECGRKQNERSRTEPIL